MRADISPDLIAAPGNGLRSRRMPPPEISTSSSPVQEVGFLRGSGYGRLVEKP
jgi:hypothetical protein